MEFNLISEYGRRVNENVRVLALVAAALFAIFLAFNSEDVRHADASADTDTKVEYVLD